MKRSIFKANDIRGKYPDEINEETVFEIAEAVGKYFNLKASAEGGSSSGGKIVIAYDARLSSPSLCEAILKGLKASARGGSSFGGKSSKALPAGRQVKAVSVGIATTPMFYFLVNKLKADGGIMATASHNPKEYNGLKIVGKKAMPISGKEIEKLVIGFKKPE